MSLLTALLRFIISNLGTLLGLTQGVSTQVAHATQETTPYHVQDLTFAALGDLENVGYGLFAIKTELDAILAAIGSPQQSGSPVTLPTTAPTGYGGAGASEVWDYDLGLGSVAAGDFMIAAGDLALYLVDSEAKFDTQYPGGWFVSGDWGAADQTEPNVNFPVPFDPSTILSTDASLPDWTTRVQPGGGWSYDVVGRPQMFQPSSTWVWTYFMGTLEFAEYKAAVFGATPAVTGAPPVWPGLAGVTLGTPVDLAVGVTITEPMHGVLISITDVPARMGSFAFDTVTSWRNIGALSFGDDNGDYEFPQTLGFAEGVYCPKAMTEAASVVVRTTSGVVGTVTPWTLL